MTPSAFLNNPIFAASLLPLVVAVAVAGMIRLAGGPGRGAVLADAAIGLGVLAVFVAVFHAVPFLDPVSNRAIGEVAVMGLVLGAALALKRPSPELQRMIALAAPAAILFWLGGLRLLHQPWRELLVTALLALGGSAVFARLDRARGRGMDPLVLLLVASVGLAGTAFFAGSASLAQLAGGIAAATGGFLVWNWPVARWHFGPMGLLAGGGAFFAVAATLALRMPQPPLWSLALLVAVFFAEPLAARLRRGWPSGGRGTVALLSRALAPLVLGLVAALPAFGAFAIAYLTTRGAY